MRARTLIRFSDLKSKKVREVGDEFEVTKTRLDEINSALKVALVEVIKEKESGGKNGTANRDKTSTKNKK